MRLRAISVTAVLGIGLFSAGAQLRAGRSDDKQAAAIVQSARSDSPTHWAYRPVKRPEPPKVQHQEWVRTPIDAFVLARLEEKDLAPSPDADRATFIRRATLDVWGVIPAPEEVAAFVTDRSPDAYEKLVDRLLASPRYGERQTRRWLDLARYADSTGFEGDRTRPNMWRYRDYVIDAFNRDKPYDQFVKEQLAGDELAPGDQASLIATGFLAGYPDNYNSRDMVQRKYQITTDMTDTVGAVFLAQTVGCARCHNHKFDRLSQKEYFQLQSFFANTAEVNDIPAAITPQEIEYQKAQARWEEATKDDSRPARGVVERDSSRDDQVPEGTLPDRHAGSRSSSRGANGRPLDRWVNHRWENVTTGSDYEIDRYLRETAQLELEETGHEEREEAGGAGRVPEAGRTS